MIIDGKTDRTTIERYHWNDGSGGGTHKKDYFHFTWSFWRRKTKTSSYIITISDTTLFSFLEECVKISFIIFLRMRFMETVISFRFSNTL